MPITKCSPQCENILTISSSSSVVPHLDITLFKCHNLAAKDLTGYSDPFVKFKLGNNSLKSSTKMRTLNPDYEAERFLLYVSEDEQLQDDKLLLYVSVYDWDQVSSSSDFIGMSSVSLKSLMNGVPRRMTLNLKPLGSGTVDLCITAHNLPDSIFKTIKCSLPFSSSGAKTLTDAERRMQERVANKQAQIQSSDSSRGKTADYNIDVSGISATQAKFEDSNIAAIGSLEDIALKVEAAKSEKAWEQAGKSEGIQIWRIEKFTVKAWPKELYGKFFDGDSYIVLRSYKESPTATKMLYDVHYWLGLYSSQDEIGTAAYKTVELDTLLGDVPVQYREVQGSETARFLSYFPYLVTMNGGIASGFNAVDYKKALSGVDPRLYWIKSRGQSIQVRQVPLEVRSLNSGDTFLLDLGKKMIIWNGKTSNKKEQFQAVALCSEFNNQRNTTSPHFVITEGDDTQSEEGKEFWNHLKGDRQDVRPADDTVPVPQVEKKLYKISDVSGELTFSLVARGKLSRDMLDSNDAFLLDVGEAMYVWVGSKASTNERKHCMNYAALYAKQSSIPLTTPTVRVMEGTTHKEFYSFF